MWKSPTHPKPYISPYISPYFNANHSAKAQDPFIEVARAKTVPVPNLPLPSGNRSASHLSYPPKPFSDRYNALRPSRGTPVELEQGSRNESTLPAVQTTSCLVSRINPPPHTSQVPGSAFGGIRPGYNKQNNTHRSMQAVETTANTGTIAEESYTPFSNAYDRLSLSSRALVSQAGHPRFLQHTQRSDHQPPPVYGKVTGRDSLVPTSLSPGTAQSVNTVPSASLDRKSAWWNSSDALVNDILHYEGVLSGNDQVEYSKLDKSFHILPEHDKDSNFYTQYAQPQHPAKRKREVIIIKDNSDEEAYEAGDSGNTNRTKKARTSYTSTIVNAMPPLYDTHGHKRQNGIVENNPRLSSSLSDLENSDVRQDLTTLPSRTSHLTKQTHRDSLFKVVIPLPSAKNMQNQLSRVTSHAHPDTVLNLADETPSATRTPNGRAGLMNFPAQVRGSPAPASSMPYTMSANGKKRGRPFSTPEAAARVSEKVFRVVIQQTPSNDAIPIGPLTINGKKRGRPFQTPEAAAAAAARAARLGNADTTNAELKKRGRPFSVNKESVIPDGKYLPFLCEWEGCLAQLNNLSTLRLHLTIIHGIRDKAVGTIPCRWGKCAIAHTAEVKVAALGNTSDENVTHTTSVVALKRRSEWKQHIEEAHLIPFSWHMGDGPADETFSRL
jgi:hypothetical protein